MGFIRMLGGGGVRTLGGIIPSILLALNNCSMSSSDPDRTRWIELKKCLPPTTPFSVQVAYSVTLALHVFKHDWVRFVPELSVFSCTQ